MKNKREIIFWSSVAIICIAILVYKYLTADLRAYREIHKGTSISSSEYRNFIYNHPSSKYSDSAYYELYKQARSNKFEHYFYSERVEKLSYYISDCSFSPYKNLAITEIRAICDSLYKKARLNIDSNAWVNYIQTITIVELDEFTEKINLLCDSLYGVAKNENTIKSWRKFISIVPESKIKDAVKIIQQIEDKQWDTDVKAWNSASKMGSIKGIQKYLSLYPYGKYSNIANKKLIDLQVSEIYNNPHGFLPSMDRISSNPNSKTSSIEIENLTAYTLTILYSGYDSRRIVISSKTKSNVELINGVYRIAASVDAFNVRPYAGTERLDGSNYSISYYIQTYKH